jgi:hypothetical protein
MEPYYAGGGPKWFHGSNPSLRENLRYAPADDDLNYTVLSLAVLDQWGLDFSPECVLEKWLALLPFRAVCTAEKLAYRNRILGMDYPEVARYRNPYKEWIGAQIRTDAYGYVLPGRPADAARLGWQDAAASHVANGIYGAMWVSAALAAAVVERDPETVIRRGLEQVPAGSRFTRHVLRTIDVARANGDDYEKTFDDIAARLGSYHCVHTINNACVVVAALLHGAGEFGRTICVAVMGGLDTDCNGATAGSIAGAMLGPEAIDAKWSAPLNDTLHTALVNHAEVRISELARRTTELAERLA